MENLDSKIVSKALSISANKARYLIVLDYIKGYSDNLKDWISRLQQAGYVAQASVRLLLVERYMFRDLYPDYRYTPSVKLSFIDPLSRLMRLRPLNDTSLRELVAIFAKWLSKSSGEKNLKIENLNIDAVMQALKAIDRDTARPLYAMFLTGASMENEDVRQWDQEKALEYACRKEYDDNYYGQTGRLYSACIAQFDAEDGKRLYENLIDLLLLATLTLGLELEKDTDKLDKRIRQLIDEIKTIAVKNRKYSRDSENPPFVNLVTDLLELTDGHRLTQIEPDLLGEYYCVWRLRKLENDVRSMWISRALRYNGRNTAIVAGRIIGDYGRSDYNLLGDMANLFSNVTLEKDIEPGQYAETIIEKVECEEGVTVINERGFYKAERLRSVIISEGLTDIGRRAFCECVALREVIIPASVTKIGAWAFQGCSALARLIVLSNTTEIDVGAFSDCIALSEISIQSGTRIHIRAFENTSVQPGMLPVVEGVPEAYILRKPPLRTLPGVDDIEWRTLDIDGNRALLISEYCIEKLPYDDVTLDEYWSNAYIGTTWAECALRKYLNSREYRTERKPWFKDRTIASEENETAKQGVLKKILAGYHKQKERVTLKEHETAYTAKTKGFMACFPVSTKIHLCEVLTLPNYVNKTNGGEEIQNQSVFLLSLDEVDRYFRDNKDRRAYFRGDTQIEDKTASWWWLRSPGYTTSNAAVVSTVGHVDIIGIRVDYSAGGVRPALWLNL